MMKKRGRGRGGAMSAEETALSARRAGLLDAYTESNTQAMSDSDKFKEGYSSKKKGKGKEKSRKSESEEISSAPVEDPALGTADDEPTESWDKEEEIIDSWEDIEAPEMPVPVKVKQEQRKKEKLRKKKEDQEKKNDSTNAVVEKMENITIQDHLQGNPPDLKTGLVAETNLSADEVKADREAKKAAKAAAKAGAKNKKGNECLEAQQQSDVNKETLTDEQQKKKEEKAKRKAEFEAKKAAEAAEKGSVVPEAVAKSGEKSKAEMKAERRAKQEAQRAAKTQGQDQKKVVGGSAPGAPSNTRVPDEIQADQQKVEKKIAKSLASHNLPPRAKAQKVAPLFSHLHQYERETALTNELPVTGGNIHPSFVSLGLQLIDGHVFGCERKCFELLRSVQDVALTCVSEITNLTQVEIFKEIDNALKPNLLFLKQCRPLSISMANSVRAIKARLKSLDSIKADGLEAVVEEIKSIFSSFCEENLTLAAQQISLTAGKMILNGDVILTYSENDLVEQILVDASKEKKFKVIVVDGRVQLRGSQMAARLIEHGIQTTYILVSAVTQVLNTVTKVFLGCEGVMANGGVLAQVGTSQVALLAESVGVPVLMCCQSFKFTERVQTDSFVYNELLDPEEVANTPNGSKYLEKWKEQSSVHLLNLAYDVTPASLVSAVITEISVVPTTSVPVILRLKNSEASY